MKNFAKKSRSALFSGIAIFVCLVSSAAAIAQEADQAVEILRMGIPHDSLYALEMSGSKGLAVGHFGLMLETTDGGSTWTEVPPLTSLALLGATRAGGHQLVVGQQGLALTRDGDGDWKTVDTGFTQRLLNVAMNASGLAVTVGEFGFIGRSRDFGATWEAVPIDWNDFNDEGYEPHMYGVIVKADGTVLVGGEFGLIMRSTDGGDTFETVASGEQSVFDIALAADGSNTGYAVGQEGLVLKTTDGGDTWERLTVDTNSNLLGVWSGNGEVVISGIRQMLRSSNDGATFSKATDLNVVRTWFQGIAAGVADSASGASGAIQEQSVYVVGFRGTIARVVQ
jgi:photosystem II stability/assembly factor-like uncharacterized protein